MSGESAARHVQSEAQHLLTDCEERVEMADGPSPVDVRDKNITRVEPSYTDDGDHAESPRLTSSIVGEAGRANEGQSEYRVYRMRWFGLAQLILLNIIVSWDWLSYSAVSNTAATFYSTTPSVINWLSTSFLFSFSFSAPLVIYTLHTSGPRGAIISCSLLVLLGNWIRYAAARASPPNLGLTMFGQILIGLAQPFVLSAPTRYSDLWFSPQGRVSATAVASLANAFGGALGQLIGPFLATCPSEIPNMILYIAIISTVATLPSIFIPSKPPTPVSPSSTHTPPNLRTTLRLLSKNPQFYLLLIPFSVYVGLFNSTSSLITQILTPYNFSETASGIAGALLILVGLVAAAITSPLVDRTKAYLPLIKILVPIIFLAYLAFIWAPGTRSPIAPYIILSILGAACFSLVPVALEWFVEITFPVGPAAGSTILWAGGQLLGAVFIVIDDALKMGPEGDPPGGLGRALVFQAVLAGSVVPCAMVLGLGRAGERKRGGVDSAGIGRIEGG